MKIHTSPNRLLTSIINFETLTYNGCLFTYCWLGNVDIITILIKMSPKKINSNMFNTVINILVEWYKINHNFKIQINCIKAINLLNLFLKSIYIILLYTLKKTFLLLYTLMTNIHAMRVTNLIKNENSIPTILNYLIENSRDNKMSSISTI